jgi:anti-anti-sigma factor
LYEDRQLRVTLACAGGARVIRLYGEVDATNSAELARALAAARGVAPERRPGGETLVVDVGRLSFIDLSGLYALAEFTRDAPARVRDVPPQLRRLLELLGLTL